MCNIYFQQSLFEQLHNQTTWLVILFTIIVPFVVSICVKDMYRKKIRCGGLLAFSVYAIYAMTLMDRLDSGAARLNMHLFWTWQLALDGSALHQYFILGNILLFIPFGVAVTLLFSRENRRWWKVLLIGLLTSVVIEAVQYVGHLGLCELDDVVHNGLGMVLGYFLIVVGSYTWDKLLDK